VPKIAVDMLANYPDPFGISANSVLLAVIHSCFSTTYPLKCHFLAQKLYKLLAKSDTVQVKSFEING
jgi:hypothetical protein